MNQYREEIKQYLIGQFNLMPEQVEDLLPGLINTLSEHIQSLERALKSGDLERLGKTAHTIKGALLNLGLHECADIAHSVEQKGKAGQEDVDYRELVDTIRAKLDCYTR